MNGIFDRVDINNDHLSIVEYKTSLSPYRIKNEKFLQLQVYMYAYEKINKIRPEEGVLTCLETGRQLIYKSSESKMKEIGELITNVGNLIYNDNFDLFVPHTYIVLLLLPIAVPIHWFHRLPSSGRQKL